ncbi:hypothetical protein ASPCADRAFT_207221 [Aspergillus carbonarius ITEM 5010]|uniref:Uncharacterized protein n=1 Tax=Aspergillus carbonarius (strain ITEM 5010) TaxID=602072 RepID=A0A1R3RN26_ASPC5|nr:hypothetical protein ASPCADRAFT_207221 [Aspergillus carbonarius ITEM 5010]
MPKSRSSRDIKPLPSPATPTVPKRPPFNWDPIEDSIMLHSIVKVLSPTGFPRGLFKQLQQHLGEKYYSAETLRKRWWQVNGICEVIN